MTKSLENAEVIENLPIARQILTIRGKQVLLDFCISELYGVETKRVNEQVKRNADRFPKEFCFQITRDETETVKSQIATSRNISFFSGQGGGRRKLPYAFTEQGVAMLSAVLHSKSAIQVSIDIINAFVYMRHYMLENGGLVNRLSNVETKVLDHDNKINELFEELDKSAVKSKGLFYENQEFDAYVFVCDLIRKAKKQIVLVDNYVNEKVLAMMLKRTSGVTATIYTYNKSKVFEVDLAVYNEQYKDSPLKIFPSYGMHDRFLFIDDDAYHFGASLKDLGKNTFFFSRESFTLEEVLKR